MNSENRYPPQDENAPNNANTEFFRSPQYPQPQPFISQQQPFSPSQFPSAYVPPQPPPFQPTQPQKRSFGQWLASKKRSTKFGLGCGAIFVILLLCTVSLAAYGSTLPKQVASPTPTPSAKNTSGGIVQTNPTTVPTPPPTVTPTQQSTATLQPTATPPTQPTATQALRGSTATNGTPEIGSLMSDFIGKYGQPNDHSDATSKHWMRSSNSNVDGLIVFASDGKDVDLVTLAAINGDVWTQTSARDVCMAYTPTDAKKTNQIPLSTNNGYDVIYTSSLLASKFSADNFTDAKGNTAQPGTFDIQYLTNPDGSINSCSVGLGSQQAT